MKNEKLTLYRKPKTRKDGAAAVVRIEEDAYLRAEELCNETGLSMRKIVSLLVNYACDNVEIVDKGE